MLTAGELVELLVAVQAGLVEHLVDERGLAVVDVGDDRHVAEVGRRNDEASAWHGNGTADARTESVRNCRRCGGAHACTGGRSSAHEAGQELYGKTAPNVSRLPLPGASPCNAADKRSRSPRRL